MLSEIRYCFEKDWNEKKYWKRRNYVQSHQNGRLLTYIKLILLRRTESKKCCTTGLSLNNKCCIIESPLVLHHGLNGIIIAPNVHIGKNVTIYQNVTISKDNPDKITIIEDDVIIYANAVILNNVKIGKGAIIGCNSVVTHEVAPNTIVAGVPAKVIKKI